MQRPHALIPDRNSVPDRRSPPEILEVSRRGTRSLVQRRHPIRYYHKNP
jgi:hypothetical protein